MISKKVLAVAVLAVAVVGAGSASVLSSFGTIGGTVSVDPAFEIKEINWNESKHEYESVVIEFKGDSFDASKFKIGDDEGTETLVSDKLISAGEYELVDESDTSPGEGKLLLEGAIAGSGLQNSENTVYIEYDGIEGVSETYLEGDTE